MNRKFTEEEEAHRLNSQRKPDCDIIFLPQAIKPNQTNQPTNQINIPHILCGWGVGKGPLGQL